MQSWVVLIVVGVAVGVTTTNAEAVELSPQASRAVLFNLTAQATDVARDAQGYWDVRFDTRVDHVLQTYASPVNTTRLKNPGILAFAETGPPLEFVGNQDDVPCSPAPSGPVLFRYRQGQVEVGNGQWSGNIQIEPSSQALLVPCAQPLSLILTGTIDTSAGTVWVTEAGGYTDANATLAVAVFSPHVLHVTPQCGAGQRARIASVGIIGYDAAAHDPSRYCTQTWHLRTTAPGAPDMWGVHTARFRAWVWHALWNQEIFVGEDLSVGLYLGRYTLPPVYEPPNSTVPSCPTSTSLCGYGPWLDAHDHDPVVRSLWRPTTPLPPYCRLAYPAAYPVAWPTPLRSGQCGNQYEDGDFPPWHATDEVRDHHELVLVLEGVEKNVTFSVNATVEMVPDVYFTSRSDPHGAVQWTYLARNVDGTVTDRRTGEGMVAWIGGAAYRTLWTSPAYAGPLYFTVGSNGVGHAFWRDASGGVLTLHGLEPNLPPREPPTNRARRVPALVHAPHDEPWRDGGILGVDMGSSGFSWSWRMTVPWNGYNDTSILPVLCLNKPVSICCGLASDGGGDVLIGCGNGTHIEKGPVEPEYGVFHTHTVFWNRNATALEGYRDGVWQWAWPMEDGMTGEGDWQWRWTLAAPPGPSFYWLDEVRVREGWDARWNRPWHHADRCPVANVADGFDEAFRGHAAVVSALMVPAFYLGYATPIDDPTGQVYDCAEAVTVRVHPRPPSRPYQTPWLWPIVATFGGALLAALLLLFLVLGYHLREDVVMYRRQKTNVDVFIDHIHTKNH